MMTEKLTIAGKDNYGKPRQDFADRIGAMTDHEFMGVAESSIWLSAYANNNSRSDYHWQADACYDEAKRRGNLNLYKTAYDRAVRSAS